MSKKLIIILSSSLLFISTILFASTGEYITFDNYGLTIKKGAIGAIRLKVVDSSWQDAAAASNIVVSLSGKYYDSVTYIWPYPADTTARFYSSSDGSTEINQLTIPAGQSSAVFYYKTNADYSTTIVDIAYTIGYEKNQQYWVNTVYGGISGSNIHNGNNTINKDITISGSETAYIDFNFADSRDTNVSWKVLITTTSNRTGYIWQRYGYGIPYKGQISWNGNMEYSEYSTSTYVWHNEKAPNGKYYVRIQMGENSSLINDDLTVTIKSLQISGRVTDQSGNGIGGVSVNAYGPGYSYAVSNTDGYYILAGLGLGSYNINYYKEGYASVNVSGINSGDTKDVVMQIPSYIKINAHRGISSAIVNQEAWGSIQIFSSASNNPYYCSFHFAVDVSTSDNAQYTYSSVPKHEINNTAGYEGGKWSIIEVVPGTYDLTASLSGSDNVTKTGITVASGETKVISDIVFPFKKGVYGVVNLPAPAADSWGAWISIEAVPEGSSWGTAWGWAQLQQGQSSGTYSVLGLSAGKYTFRASGTGYRRSSVSVTLNEGDEVVNAAPITLDTGLSLSGTITVEGDTTDSSVNQYLYGDPFFININAWSPDTYGYGWTQCNINKNTVTASSTFTISGLEPGSYWLNSWLYGFDLEGTVGWNGVKATVSSTGGTINLKFKRYSGKIKCTFKVPDNDYANLKISVNGMNIWASDVTMANILSGTNSYGIKFDTNTGVMITPPLGTGFYQLKGEYTGTGCSKTKSIMAINGQTKETSIDLTAQTYSVSGKVLVSNTNPPSGYNSISSLYSVVVESMTVAMNNMQYNGMISTTTFRVKAIDYSNIESLSTVSGDSGNLKSGMIGNDGAFAISGLVPGVYILKIDGFEIDNNWMNGKETAVTEKKVVIIDKNITGEELEISKGYSVTGTLKLPTGETANRMFSINIYKADKFKVSNFGNTSGDNWSNYAGYTGVNLFNVNSSTYEIKGLSSGEYVIAVYDMGYGRQYANLAINVKVQTSNLTGQDLNMTKGGKISFKLRDADSNTIITPKNALTMLPETYTITAIANPWIDGGWGGLSNSKYSGTLPSISSATAENIQISFLPEAVYDVTFGQSSYGTMGSSSMLGEGSMSNKGGNSTNYAAKTVSSIKVVNGQTKDIGTIDIKQGLTIAGIVKDKNGNGIPNIPVLALPSLSNEFSSELRGFTDINGKYSIVGLNPDNPYYDIIACPRIDPRMFGGYYFFGAGGIAYGEKVMSMVKIATAGSIDFVLDEAKGSVIGKVTTEDGGVFQNPEDLNLPTAKVFMQKEDTFPRTNPIGDIVTDTQVDGTFSIEALAPGVYNLMIISGGYTSYAKTVAVSDTQIDLGTMRLKLGAKISGKITKIDGKNPSTTEINSIVAASDDFSEILFGALKTSGEKTVIGYDLNGFQPGINYNMMFLGEGDEMIPAAVNYSVPYSTYVKTDYDLTYQVAAPAVFSRSKREGTKYTINFELSSALRKSTTDDDDLTKIITLISGAGAVSDRYMAPSRKSLSCVYTAPAAETRFSIKLHGYSKVVNPETGNEFEVNESFEYYAGIGAKNRVKVSNLRGGKVTLDGDSSNVQFSPGTFDMGSSTASLYIDFSRADNIDDLKAGTAGSGAPKLTIKRPAQAYPSAMYDAMKLAQTSGINPFSSFYDIMLPQGVSHTFKKDATLSLQYTSGSDASTLNVYYYDSVNKVYLLENKNKNINTSDGTISISINHASIFVILQSNAPVIQGSAYNGSLFVYNFPNPFNLSAKTVNLAETLPAPQNQVVNGTMIHYALPQSMAGEVEIKIYNVAGELVRTIKDGQKTGGSHYYTEWDGKNEDGKKAASGVYIGRFTIDKKNEKFFKMALIK